MSSKLIVVIAAIVVIAISISALKMYGDAKYSSGYDKAQSEYAEAVLKQTSTDAKELERIHNETLLMSTTDVDDDLRKLGIMRQPEDY